MCKAESDGPPRAARRTEQLRSTLWKNLLIKRRAPRTTCCEITSPALFICILVLGFYLSSIDSYPEAVYAAIRLDVGALLELAVGFTSGAADPGAFSATSLLGGNRRVFGRLLLAGDFIICTRT